MSMKFVIIIIIIIIIVIIIIIIRYTNAHIAISYLRLAR